MRCLLIGIVIVTIRALLAQRTEHRTSNPRVVGSNPTGGTLEKELTDERRWSRYMKDKAREYFEAFSNGHMEKLGELYAENVSLKDWVSEHEGRDAVLAANESLFATHKVDVKVNSIFGDGQTVVCEIEILLNDGSKKENLLVVDVLVFNQAGQVEEIRAYLGSSN